MSLPTADPPLTSAELLTALRGGPPALAAPDRLPRRAGVRDTIDIVVRHCVTRAQQEAAIAAPSFKCDVLWSMLDAIERGAAHDPE